MKHRLARLALYALTCIHRLARLALYALTCIASLAVDVAESAWLAFRERLARDCIPIAIAEQRRVDAVMQEELARAALVAKCAAWLIVVIYLVSR